MGKVQICRICRTEKNLKFTAKQLREFNKKQLLTAKKSPGTINSRASQKLLRSTPTLGNICLDCDDRIQIFHHLDDGHKDGDIEVDVDSTCNTALPPVKPLPGINENCRPDTPVIVDDDDMLYKWFIQKVDMQRQHNQEPPPLTLLPHIQQQLQLQQLQQQQNQQQQQQQQQKQQQQYLGQFNGPYTPPQSHVGSEGDDAKVIEVLTSRESTPASVDCQFPPALNVPPAAPCEVDEKGHRIVAVIDLDDDTTASSATNTDPLQKDSTINQQHSNSLLGFIVTSANYQTQTQIIASQLLLSPTKPTLLPTPPADACEIRDDDEEIVFCKVEPRLEATPPKRRTRKNYDEKQLRLVASLSLVSSDSEPEDEEKTKPKPPAAAATAPAPVIAPVEVACKLCKMSFPNVETLAVHEQVHQGFLCPVCQFGYEQEQRLVHHMRCKHRAYNGCELIENPRHSKDSAMTIRLRYMQRKNFYECQLCGRIDEVLKEHTQHIIDKHPIESKTLNDPIMKELKCPVCKCHCGTQYLTLCRHLVRQHKYNQYKMHLRELLHVSSFGWKASRQEEVTKAARIYQFSKRKSLYFQCKSCSKIVAGYANYARHAKTHSENLKANKLPEPTTKDCNKNLNISEDIQAKDTAAGTNAKKKKEEATSKEINKSTKIIKPIKKVINQKDAKSSKQIKSKIRKKSQLDKKSKKVMKAKVGKTQIKSVKEKTTQPVEQDQDIIFKKPKIVEIAPRKEKADKQMSKSQKTLPSSEKAKESVKSSKRKQNTKKEDALLKARPKKVKVKAPIKTVELQTYNCQFCELKFKGYCLYNLHLINQHAANEFKYCCKCRKTYEETQTADYHLKICADICQRRTHSKRKYAKAMENSAKTERVEEKDNRGEQSVTEVPKTLKKRKLNNISEPQALQYDWLNDLLNLRKPENAKLQDDCPRPTGETFQCVFCLHLFPSILQKTEHVKLEHSKESEALITFKPIAVCTAIAK